MPEFHMQKSEREIKDPAVIEDILIHGRYATIALCRHDQPYLVTLNYGYDPGPKALYFHTAHKGLKMEYIKANPLACAAVIEDRGYLAGKCAHAYRSVVCLGTIRLIEGLEAKKYGMGVLLKHLEKDPEVVRKRLLAADRDYDRAAVLRLDIQEATGKAGQ